jgi:cyclohexyl-isocyanide hydratase
MNDLPSNAATPRPTVAMLLYPGLTLLDLLSPHTVFSGAMDIHLVWKNLDPIVSDSGITLHPTTSFADCPDDVDILFAPGGRDQAATAADEEVLAFLEDRGSRARYVTSVCGGSLLLGSAGLLQGYKAATHWTGRDVLPLLGAENVNERVVIDRNRITGGGVTAGLDFGLVVLAEMLGENVAKITQLAMEYDPQPPFDFGSPEKAGPDLVQIVRAASAKTNDDMLRVVHELNAKGWGRTRGSVPA